MTAGDRKGVVAARDRQMAITFKVNDWRHFGHGVNETAAAIVAAASRRGPNDRLKFGQVGAIRIAIDEPPVRAIAHFDHWSDDGLKVSVDLHATNLREPFPSETGYHSVMGVKCLGGTIGDAAIAALNEAIAHATDKKLNKYAKGLTLPETAYDIGGDGAVIVKARRPATAEEFDPSAVPGVRGPKTTAGKRTKKGK
jgi:hypothetical protein